MKRSILSAIISVLVMLGGIILTVFIRSAALAEQATDSSKFLFAVGLILTLIGFVSLIISVVCSLVNDSHIKNSIRDQAVEITTVNYDEILNNLNNETIHFYETYLK